MTQPTWATVFSTIQQVIATASGLTTIWRYQGANQPALDYVGLSLGTLTTEGFDYVQASYDATRPAGSQVVLTVGGVREVALQLEVWSAAVAEASAKATALSIADQIVTRLRLPTARNALAAIGVTPFDPGPRQWLPSIVSVGFRGRATCDVRCRMPARAFAEYADFIASISGVAEVDNDAGGTVTLPFSSP